jgi:hypothetical protein
MDVEDSSDFSSIPDPFVWRPKIRVEEVCKVGGGEFGNVWLICAHTR